MRLGETYRDPMAPRRCRRSEVEEVQVVVVATDSRALIIALITAPVVAVVVGMRHRAVPHLLLPRSRVVCLTSRYTEAVAADKVVDIVILLTLPRRRRHLRSHLHNPHSLRPHLMPAVRAMT
jgi:hypothetical protein